jgi:hypothetical protein
MKLSTAITMATIILKSIHQLNCQEVSTYLSFSIQEVPTRLSRNVLPRLQYMTIYLTKEPNKFGIKCVTTSQFTIPRF